jgi:hypothetical protein
LAHRIQASRLPVRVRTQTGHQNFHGQSAHDPVLAFCIETLHPASKDPSASVSDECWKQFKVLLVFAMGHGRTVQHLAGILYVSDLFPCLPTAAPYVNTEPAVASVHELLDEIPCVSA